VRASNKNGVGKSGKQMQILRNIEDRHIVSYNGRLIGSHICAFDW